MLKLPDQVSCYSHSPTFGPDTMPGGLTHDHQTQSNVWAKIVVLSGQVRFSVTDGADAGQVFVLSPALSGVVAPLSRHHIQCLSDDTRFMLEFYR
ncbi:MAG: hypothetical protein RL210_1341 [Pseudomonadota bacterium]|jgi:tellurite methyltransferase|nr:hypothetical protein [Pseudomonadota bacterium]